MPLEERTAKAEKPGISKAEGYTQTAIEKNAEQKGACRSETTAETRDEPVGGRLQQLRRALGEVRLLEIGDFFFVCSVRGLPHRPHAHFCFPCMISEGCENSWLLTRGRPRGRRGQRQGAAAETASALAVLVRSIAAKTPTWPARRAAVADI